MKLMIEKDEIIKNLQRIQLDKNKHSVISPSSSKKETILQTPVFEKEFSKSDPVL